MGGWLNRPFGIEGRRSRGMGGFSRGGWGYMGGREGFEGQLEGERLPEAG